MSTTPLEAAQNAFRLLESGARAASAVVTDGTWKTVLLGVGAGAGLAADLIDLGLHPVDAITRIRSAVPDFDAVTTELENFAKNGR